MNNDTIKIFVKTAGIISSLYLFLVGIAGMSSAIKRMGSEFAETVLTTTSDPFIALFIGIFATVLFQSSSTTTSLIVGMVSSGSLTIASSIPMIMGANIGTTVTNTIVSVGHINKGTEFKRAFAASTVKVSKPADLDGLSVGVTRGTLEDLEITKTAPKGAKITRFGDNAATLSAFKSGQVDVLVAGNTAAAALASNNPSLDIVRKFIIKDSPCFIGVKKGNEDLLRWVNVFILHKKLGGDLNKISQKWLGQDLPPLPSL